MILLVSSGKDIASLNIKAQVLGHYEFESTESTFQKNPVYSATIGGKEVRLITLAEEAIAAQYLPEYFADLNLVVFITRHSSQSGKPTLSVHTPGNLGPAELGGLPRNVSVSAASAMRDALKALRNYSEEECPGYEVSYEGTHHGPSLNLPSMFVELGSSLEQWHDSKAAEVVAHASVEAIMKFGKTENTAALGIGGPHYNRRFTKMALNDEEIFGHMIPKYALPYTDPDILNQCIEKTLEKVTHAVLDWKGIPSEEKPRLLDALKEIGLPYRKA